MFKKNGEILAKFSHANEMINRIESDPLMLDYLTGEKQTIMSANLFNVDWKIKMDFYNERRIVDLKTVKDFEDIYDPDYGWRSWIEYWQVLSEESEEGLCCSNVECGCNIVMGLSDEFIREYNRQHPLNQLRQACGAHVEKRSGSGDYYIAPLCDQCNSEGNALTLRAGTILVKEITPNISC